MNSENKLDYFLSHPVQYFSPLFKSLAKYSDLTVYYYSDASIKGYTDAGFGREIKWDVPLLSGYRSVVLENRSGHKNLDNKFWDVLNPGIWKILWKCEAKVIVLNGWAYSTDIVVIILGRLLGKKVWVRSENPLNQELRKSQVKLFIKKLFFRHFLFRFFVTKGLYIGKQSKDFFSYYGLGEDKLIFTPYAVDNDYFQSQAFDLSIDIRALKSSLNIDPTKKVVLFSGKYISKKRPMDLIKAFESLKLYDVVLVMMGEGELRQEMEAHIYKKSIKNVLLTGFVNQSQVSKYYAVCDVFVMCSGMDETWGLSINEAMNFAKPIIVSDTCGSSADLVRQGENGYIFKEGDIRELAGYLALVLTDGSFRASAGLLSQYLVGEYSINRIVDNLVRELNEV